MRTIYHIVSIYIYTIKSTFCEHRCFAKTYLSSVWEQYTIYEYNYLLEGMYFEKHIEPVNDNNTQAAVCGHSCSLKGAMKIHIEPVHDSNIPHKCKTICL